LIFLLPDERVSGKDHCRPKGRFAMKNTIIWIVLGAVALSGLLILAFPDWMMFTGSGGGYGMMMHSGMSQSFGGGAPSPRWMGMWLGWANQFLWLALLVIGVGGVMLMKTKN
jgi:hypothetical protein